MNKNIFFWLIAGLVLFSDQGVKFLVQSLMYEGQTVPVLGSFFHFTYILNPGAAFGLFAYKTWMLICLAGLVIAAVIIFYRRIMEQAAVIRLALALEMAGTMGNLLDRLRLGYVVDFLDFRIWPIFNIADIAIVTGVGLLFYYLIFLDEKADKEYGKI